MIVQHFRRDVPEVGAWVERAHLRHPRFVVSVVRGAGLALDWGMQAEAVRFIARLRRTQLSMVLEGRGYFLRREGLLELGPGDLVVSDQRLGEHEGYGGSPMEALFVEWDDDAHLGAAHRGPSASGRADASVVRALSSLVARLHDTPPARWVAELGALLRALGLRLGAIEPGALAARPRAPVSQLFRALGDALTRMEEHPSLAEVAGSIARTERQTHRLFDELGRDFTHPSESWREFVTDARIGWAMQALSIPGLTQERVARLSGFRSVAALQHAFSLRGAGTPGSYARRLAERWRG